MSAIPQVISIVRVSRGGQIVLKKRVQERLGSKDVGLATDHEIRLLADGVRTPEVKANRLCLPEEICKLLDVSDGDLIAMIERQPGVALKKVVLEERHAKVAKIEDRESRFTLSRVVSTWPPADALVEGLVEKCRGRKLRHRPTEFLRGRASLAAWKGRRLLGAEEPGDAQLKARLVDERVRDQADDGSWGQDLVLTARCLRELIDLGCSRRHRAVRRAAEWLLARPQSRANPGMFFLTDELGAARRQLLDKKEKTRAAGLRFRARKPGEIGLVLPGDDLLRDPSGPRIMWPNGLALEALLAAGYEKRPRVQAALQALRHGNWCECGYQHGLACWRRKEPLMREEIQSRLDRSRQEFDRGGVSSTEELASMDLTKTHGFRLLRVSHRQQRGLDVYGLDGSRSLQSCAFITTRAMGKAKDQRLRDLAEAELWRYAGMQRTDGSFPDGGRARLHELEAAVLQLFATMDGAVSKIAILRAVPWIVKSQNRDGSWGEESRRDAATLAVLSALAAVRRCLPSGFVR